MGFMSTPAAAGDFNTYIKFDAKAGRWYTKPDGGGDLYEVETPTAIYDLENIRTGWFQFFDGQAPVKVFDPSLTEAAPKPSPEAKRGFEVLLYSDKNIGGLRELCSTAAAVITEMNDLYDAWQAEKANHPGQLPVVKCKGVNPVKSGKSTNYRPVLEIAAWADVPQALVDAQHKGEAPSETTKGKVAPTSASSAKVAVTADDEVDF